MIGNILEMLKIADGNTHNIQIAQGKNNLPKTIRETFSKFKKENKWQQK
jgi:hypothetical protein